MAVPSSTRFSQHACHDNLKFISLSWVDFARVPRYFYLVLWCQPNSAIFFPPWPIQPAFRTSKLYFFTTTREVKGFFWVSCRTAVECKLLPCSSSGLADKDNLLAQKVRKQHQNCFFTHADTGLPHLFMPETRFSWWQWTYHHLRSWEINALTLRN